MRNYIYFDKGCVILSGEVLFEISIFFCNENICVQKSARKIHNLVPKRRTV